MAIHTIRVIKGGRTVLRKQVSEGLGRTDAVVIPAQADVLYLLGDTLNNTGPGKIRAKRVGKNLQVAIGTGNPDVPDFIIEGYFDFPPALIAGTLPDGGQAAYDLGNLMLANNSNAAMPAMHESAATQASLPSGDMGAMGWTLGALVGALALSGGGKSGSGSNSTSDPATTAQNKVIGYANDGTAAAPVVADYTAIGVTGVNDKNLSAINSAVEALASTHVETKAKLQIVIDAYNKILAEANGAAADATAGVNPTVADYAAVGATIGSAVSNPAALNLLNEVIGALTTTAVDTIAEINALAIVVDKVMNTAAGTPAALTVADFALLGLSTSGTGAVTSNNLAAVIAAIGNAGGQAQVDTYLELSNLVTAVATIVSYAADNTQSLPVLANYTNMGITGVTTTNLTAMNSAVDALASTNVDTKVKLQAVVDAYNKILAEANGSTADATPGSNPTAQDYATIGANIGTAATNSTSLTLLNDVVGGLTTTAIDTVAEINALAAVVDKVMGVATGGAGTLSVADLALLGLPVTGAGAVTSVNIVAINNAIANAGGTSKVDTLVELSNLVTAVATIVTYADDSTQAAPTLTQYTTAGITGVTATNLAAINSAVDANSASGVDTKAELQAIVDAYNFILAEANGAATDATPTQNPTAAQFALIGANIGNAATNSVNLSLLDDAIAGLTSTAVDTVQEINDLAAAANAVMTGAAGGVAPTLAQLALLGITGVTINNIQAVQNAIAATADSGLQVDTMAQLQALVTTAVNAAATSQTLLQNYAASSANPAPTLTDYTNIGVTGVDATNLASINSAVDALTSSGVDTPYHVQSVVTAYNKILAEANGAAADLTPGNDPTANDFVAIGASVGLAAGGIATGTDLASSALKLLDNALGAMTTTAVDTVGEINAIGAVVDKVMNLAKLATGASIPAGALTMGELTLLGVDTHLADTTLEVNAILQAIIDSADSGSGVNTLAALQNIVNANAH